MGKRTQVQKSRAVAGGSDRVAAGGGGGGGARLPVRRVADPAGFTAGELAVLEAASGGPVRVISFDILYEATEGHPPMPPAVAEQFDALFELVREFPAEAIGVLEPLARAWPGVPQLANLLMAANARAGRTAEAERLTEDAFVRFPDYLFARINFAQLSLDRGYPDAVLPALGGDFDLTRIYPGRTAFHVSEVVGLYALMGNHLIATGEVERAGLCLDLLDEIAPDHPQTAALEHRLEVAAMEAAFRMFADRSRRPKKTVERRPAAKKVTAATKNEAAARPKTLTAKPKKAAAKPKKPAAKPKKAARAWVRTATRADRKPKAAGLPAPEAAPPPGT